MVAQAVCELRCNPGDYAARRRFGKTRNLCGCHWNFIGARDALNEI
jgi:hypothetical protein